MVVLFTYKYKEIKVSSIFLDALILLKQNISKGKRVNFVNLLKLKKHFSFARRKLCEVRLWDALLGARSRWSSCEDARQWRSAPTMAKRTYDDARL